jgi:hypothetical protein
MRFHISLNYLRLRACIVVFNVEALEVFKGGICKKSWSRLSVKRCL